jgi:prephenate dehydrogenase
VSGLHFSRLAIVGCGLLGGSLGMAARARGLCAEVIGVGRSSETLDEASRLGAITRAATDLKAGVAEADLVVLCTPVRHIISILPAVLAAVKPGAIVTDVGSTKLTIVQKAEELCRGTKALFVGSHPMAGAEKSGIRHAKETLYSGTNCFVTKTAATDLQAFARVCQFWEALDTRVVIARPERHDHLVALVSHLPHLVAVALVRTVQATGEDKNLMKGIVGNGFRDSTRIARSSAEIWDDIWGENAGEMETARRAFEAALSEIMALPPEDGAPLRALLEQVSQFRGALEGR